MTETSKVILASYDEVNYKLTNLDVIVGVFNHIVGNTIKKGERILLKTHFGKRGALAHFRPAIISAIVEAVKEKGALPT
ncbi:MAG: hypothetical protein ACTSYA_13245, partial [Candidatus Kariarchaeaceae archaeon]